MKNTSTPLILVIDDNFEIRLLRQKLLQKNGYQVISCDNGKEGIELAIQNIPDLILLDVVMPVMGGLEVLQNLKENENTACAFTILISGQQKSSEEIAEGLALGADGYLTAPIPNVRLVSQLKTFLRQKFAMDNLRRSKKEIQQQNQQLEHLSSNLTQVNSEYKILNAELTQAMQLLKTSENKYKLLANNSNNIVWAMQLDGSLSYISPSIFKVLGYTPQEMMNLKPNEYSTPDFASIAFEKIKIIIESKKAEQSKDFFSHLELKQQHKNGSSIWVEVNTSPIYNENKELTGILGTTRDINIKKSLELENVKNLERYKIAQQMGKVGNWDYDLQTGIFWGSDEAKSIYGLDLDAANFTTDDVENCIPERDRVHQTLVDLIEGKGKYDIEFEIISADTSQKKIIHSIAELKHDNDGNPWLVTGVIQDVTDQKQALKALEESEQKFKSLAETTPTAVMIYQQSKWVYANEASTKITGYSVAELLKMDFWDFVHSDFVDLVKQQGAARQKNLPAQNKYEFKIITKSGIEKWAFLSGATTSFNGKPAGIISVIDITNRKEAEIRLAESEERFRFLTDVTFEAIVIHKDGVIVDTNKAFEKITGFTKKEAIGQHLYQALINEKDFELARTNIKKDHATPYQVRAKMKNGQTFWAEIEGKDTVHQDESMRIVAIRNITDKVEARQALEQSEYKHRLVVNNSIEGIFVVQNGDIVYANPTIEKISGYSIEQIKKISFINFVYKEDRKLIIENNTKRLEGEDISFYDFRIVDYTNKPKWVHLNATKINWDNQAAILCFITDVHDRKLAENALKASEEKFRTYIQSSPTAVFIANEKGDYTFVNPAAAQMLAYTEEELLGMNISQIQYKTSSGLKNFNALKTNKSNKNTNIRLKKKTGEPIDIYLEAVKLSENEFMAYCRDISDLKNAERELQGANEELQSLNEELSNGNEEFQALNEELERGNHELYAMNIQLADAKKLAEESDRLKSLFLANMSHEIRTPMNGILGFADLLKEPELSGDEQQKYVGIIERSGERMLNIINDLIDISKIESGQMEIVKGITNINDQLAACYAFFKPEADNKDLELSFKTDFSLLDVNIFTDREKLYAILTNLIKNALKYTHEGSINFGYHRVEKPQGMFIQFYINDTGIGIAEDRQKAIFERFIQADTTIAKSYEGAGLGLAISKAYVEMLGGEIWLKSKPGTGSEFYFTIPCTYKPIADLTEDATINILGAADSMQKLNILIAEDAEYSDLYLTRIVREIGKEVLHAGNGKDAVEICRQNPEIDLILMDIKMPLMNGYDATRKIREFNKDVLIIAQTAFALQGDREKALEAGCNEYLAKPVKKNDLFALLNGYFRS